MTDFSDSLSASASLDLAHAQHEAKLQISLHAGLTALKQRDYPKAIAELSDCEASLDAATRLKAQMGLIKAYARTKQVQAAALLAQPLCDHSNPQVRHWAEQTLAELTAPDSTAPNLDTSDPPPSSDDVTGFVPLPEPPSASSLQPSPPPPSTKTRPTTQPAAETALLPRSPAAAIRTQKWNSLGKVDASGLWALQAGSLVLLFWMSKTLLSWAFGLWNEFSIAVSNLINTPRLILPVEIGLPLLLLLLGLAAASPWLLHLILRQAYGLQPLNSQLESSPESLRLLRRFCNQQRLPLPELGLLPTAAPMIFSYGYLPRRARIAVSQGLLDQLNEDETATLFAVELAHIRYWDFGTLSAITLIAQLPYLVYWQVANWGDQQKNPVFRGLAVVVSSAGYGLFRLLRLPGLWLSRVRLYYSDRLACDLTGNPNGLARALLKVASGTAQQMQQQTDPLLEGFELLAPVGFHSALPSSLYQGDAALFDWDCHSPYRRWLQLNNSHPPLGERLALLMQYAQRWRLPPEVELRQPSRPKPQLNRLVLQAAPVFGVLFGALSSLLLWAVGRLATQLRWFELSWLATEQSVFWACCLLGFGIGLFVRINPFYPDIKRANLVDFDLPQLLSDPDRLPLDSLPVQVQGKLVGQTSLQNWLYRDLMLQTSSGLIRLHYTSKLGWLSDLLPQAQRPTALIGRTVTVTGWFRRGATPWIDVDKIQVQKGRSLLSHHPIWSTALAAAAVLLAVYLILRGGG
ncbi:M48 family metallopeptidase [Rivularia sp. UHCC 0363]|uniref:M48 family metallopeptidase n=1 Tax=Rivularia sp. UHCC 0363 TaxID=3110244 RepID=UPI002B2012EF|nr:M48 family metalloprotease [Rivularia sp. UHCC 0363]MEA5597332.1 M48 family metalloprotease [Rivularia sp. UHCC 0363]